MDVLERWRPDGWRRPGRVAVANRQPLEPTSETYHGLVEGGADVVISPLRDESGAVAQVVADADIVIAGGAALDACEDEPLAADSPLIGMENVILAPHLASYSEEGDHLHRLRIAEIALQVARGGLPERQVVVNKDLYDRLATLPVLADVPRA